MLPAGDPGQECVPRSMLVHHAPDFPWYPSRAQLCGDYRYQGRMEPWYREVTVPIPGGIGGQNPQPIPGPQPITPEQPDLEFGDEQTPYDLQLFAAEKRRNLQQSWEYLVLGSRMLYQASLKVHGSSVLLPKLVK